ncbi:hypothetical protein C3486_23585 [Streptomyces sp. Ru73]|nr:hypothetical protein C3486_23585 [Streptomyces sp. Ru73]
MRSRVRPPSGTGCGSSLPTCRTKVGRPPAWSATNQCPNSYTSRQCQRLTTCGPGDASRMSASSPVPLLRPTQYSRRSGPAVRRGTSRAGAP